MKLFIRLFLCILFVLPGTGVLAEEAPGDGASAGKGDSKLPPAQFSISPDKFILPLGTKPVNSGLRINNLQKRPVTFNVDIYNWILDEKNQVKVIPSDSQSLDQWMAITPLTFTLQPGKSQVVRFSILPSVKPDPGEHRAIIFLSQQPSSDTPEEGIFRIQFRYGIGVYGWTGPVSQHAMLKSLDFDPAASSLRALITNTGNVHVRLEGYYTVWQKKLYAGSVREGRPEGERKPEGSSGYGQIEMKPVLPGTTRTVDALINLPREKGEYIISINGMLGKESVRKIFAVMR
jgi:fimbrial chaperone protein